ncbi:nitroreductase [Mycobacterium sp. URHB0021]|jgi:nitroreductase
MTDTMPQPATVRHAVELACRAPSLHNSQPWRWVTEGSTLHLFADLTRTMTAADPQGREVYLSCGAVLDHLVSAMASEGWRSSVDRFPDPHDPFHVAALQFSWAPDERTEETVSRALAIRERRTDRRPFDTPPDWEDLEVRLRLTVIPYHIMFDTVLTNARRRLAEASRLTEAIRQNDPSYEAELAWWASSSVVDEGLPSTLLTSPASPGPVDVARTFPAASYGRHQKDSGAIDYSNIVVLSTRHEDARLEVLRCGEALSAVLLDCTANGIATCTLTHMTELAQSREIVRQLVGQRGLPQVLIRIGQAPQNGETITTPRRPLAEVLEIRN